MIDNNKAMEIFLTVDTEMWPVHPGNWPHTPLKPSYDCDQEYVAYYFGDKILNSGLPHQLQMLSQHGLKATFFVDPLFSFALGLSKLQAVVNLIQSSGQAIALHLHPEWLTDPRCKHLPSFRGPFLSSYSEEAQRFLIDVGWKRLLDAGANPVRAFRAGSWGADLSTLQILADAGFTHDSSLNASYAHSLPSLASRANIHVPSRIEGITEVPVTRFDDRIMKNGRQLSLVGVSTAEMEYVLNTCYRSRMSAATIVLHSNEFTRTDRLWQRRAPDPMRLILQRFDRFCKLLAENRSRFTTRVISDATIPVSESPIRYAMPISSIHRTMYRWLGQAISRYY